MRCGVVGGVRFFHGRRVALHRGVLCCCVRRRLAVYGGVCVVWRCDVLRRVVFRGVLVRGIPGCAALLCCVVSCYVVWCCVLLCGVVWCWLLLCFVVWSCMVHSLCCGVVRVVVLCCVVLRCFVFCWVALHCAMLCHVVSCHVTRCCVLSCDGLLCGIVFCVVVWRCMVARCVLVFCVSWRFFVSCLVVMCYLAAWCVVGMLVWPVSARRYVFVMASPVPASPRGVVHLGLLMDTCTMCGSMQVLDPPCTRIAVALLRCTRRLGAP